MESLVHAGGARTRLLTPSEMQVTDTRRVNQGKQMQLPKALTITS